MVQTIHDIVKAHGGELKVMTATAEVGEGSLALPGGLSTSNEMKVDLSPINELKAETSSAIGFGRRLSAQAGSEFIIQLPLKA